MQCVIQVCQKCHVYFHSGTGDQTKLNQVAIPIVPRSTCSRPDWWGAAITEYMICGGREKQGMGACNVSNLSPFYVPVQIHVFTDQTQASNCLKYGYKGPAIKNAILVFAF